MPNIEPDERKPFWHYFMIFSRFMRTTFGTVIFVLLFLLTLIQSSWFQNWAIQKTTAYLSKELNTTVKIEHIGIDLLSNLTLDGFYVEDLRHDTLLYAERLSVDYSIGWKTIYGKGFTINGLMLENAKMFINHYRYEQNDNLQFLVDYFKSEKAKDTNKKGTPFDLKIKYLSFKKIDLRQKNEITGKELYCYLDEGAIAFDEMDLIENCIQIRSIDFIQPAICIKQKEAYPLPKANQKETPEDETPEVSKVQSSPLHFTLNRLRLNGGHFVYDNFVAAPERKKPANLMDFNHLDIENLNFDLDHLDFLDNEMTATLTGISAKESCGFILDKLAATQFKLTPKSIELNDFVVKTPYSEIRDTFQLRFRDFSDFDDFNNKVRIKASLYDSHLALKDLMPFDRKISENSFFIENQTENFKIKGNISGKINRLSADSLLVETKGISLQGNLNLNDVTDPENVFIGFKINKLESSIATLKLFANRDTLPKGVEKLGHFTFDGFFYGFPYNFSAQGHLRTALGSAKMDIVYKPDDKIGASVYNGGVDLIDFDLGEFTGNDDFGKVTLNANVNNGTGFTAKAAEADLSAKVKSFTFKNYTYENLNYSGKLDSRLVDGAFSIQDKNIDFTFNGTIDLRDKLPRYDFRAKVNHLNLASLNLTKEQLDLSGEFDIAFTGNNLDNIQGKTRLKNINAVFKGEKFNLDSLTVNATNSAYQFRRLDFSSNILEGFIEGQFDFARLPKTFKNYVVQFHPTIAKRLKIDYDPLVIGNDFVDFKLDISNTQNFTKLIHKDLDTLRGIHLEGHFDNTKNALSLSTLLQDAHFQDFKFTDLGCSANLEAGKGDVDVQLYHTVIQEKQHINLITILGKLKNDELLFDLNGNRVSGDLDSLNLNGLFSVKPEYFQVGFLNSKFTLFEERWQVNADNYLRFDNGFIEAKNFEIRSGRRQISLQSTDKRSLNCNLKGFNFHLLDALLKDNRFAFGGDFEVDLKIGDIFKLTDIEGVVNADTLIWNNRDWGKFRLDVSLKDLKSPVKTFLSITKDNEQIASEGFYVLPGNTFTSKGKTYYGNHLHNSLSTLNIPIVWIAYLAGEGVSDMVGTVDATLQVDGNIKDLKLDGSARVRNAGFTIDYLKTRYFIKDETAKISTTLIDATGAKIYDENGSYAVIEGGLTHQLFNKIRLSCTIDSKEKDVLILKTKKEDNNLYYGTGIGKVKVKFSGSFNRTNIDVQRAITSKGTSLNIPVSYAQEAEAVTFVKFKDKRIKANQSTANQEVKQSGLDFRMTLTMTEDAECKIIFNEQTGDVIKGNGKGVVQLNVPINEDFTMFGDYTFSKGDYLFTIRQNFFSVDKLFLMRPGGTLRWNGDPFGAQMDIWADYSAPNIPPYELVAPLLASDAEKQSARQPTEVKLAMNMKGKLLKPDISFDIALTQLFGQMKSYADTRLNQIKLDNAELNRQVFAIIVLGNFLPSNQQVPNADGVSQAINNTLSGLLSNQLANYINSWLHDVVKNNGIISGVDLNINTQAGLIPGITPNNLNSLQVRPRVNLFEDKLSIDAGFVTSELNNNTYISPDVAIEWYITKDRLLRFRVYNRSVQDVGVLRNRTGAGLSWRKEFETWSDLKRKKKITTN